MERCMEKMEHRTSALTAGRKGLVAAVALLFAMLLAAGVFAPQRAYAATYTMTDATGLTGSQFVRWLEDHESDYLGVTYNGGFHHNPGWSVPNWTSKIKEGAKYSDYGTNCTGFVFHAVTNAVTDYYYNGYSGVEKYTVGDAKNIVEKGWFPHMTPWQGWRSYWSGNNPSGHALETIQIYGNGDPDVVTAKLRDLVDAGKIKKGDFIWEWQYPNEMAANHNHVLIYWPSNTDKYRVMHNGDQYLEINSFKNTRLACKEPFDHIYVIPWDHIASGVQVSKTDMYTQDQTQGNAELQGTVPAENNTIDPDIKKVLSENPEDHAGVTWDTLMAKYAAGEIKSLPPQYQIVYNGPDGSITVEGNPYDTITDYVIDPMGSESDKIKTPKKVLSSDGVSSYVFRPSANLPTASQQQANLATTEAMVARIKTLPDSPAALNGFVPNDATSSTIVAVVSDFRDLTTVQQNCIYAYRGKSGTGELGAYTNWLSHAAGWVVNAYDAYRKHIDEEYVAQGGGKEQPVTHRKTHTYTPGQVVDCLQWTYFIKDGRLWATTEKAILPEGDYTIIEANPPTGYKAKTSQGDSPWKENFSVTDGSVEWHVFDRDSTTLLDNSKVEAAGPDNDVKRGDIKIRKADREQKSPDPQGNWDLSGVKFEIINRCQHPVYTVDGRLVEPGDVVCTIISDKNGLASTELTAKRKAINGWTDSNWPANKDKWSNALPIGEYEVVEVYTPAGYHSGIWEFEQATGKRIRMLYYHAITNGIDYPTEKVNNIPRPVARLHTGEKDTRYNETDPLFIYPIAGSPETIAEDGDVVSFDNSSSWFYNDPWRGDISVQKYNAELYNREAGEPHENFLNRVQAAAINVASGRFYDGNANMAHAQFTIWNVSRNYITNEPQDVRVWTLEDGAGGVQRRRVETVVPSIASKDAPTTLAYLQSLAEKLTYTAHGTEAERANYGKAVEAYKKGIVIDSAETDDNGFWTTDATSKKDANGNWLRNDDGYLAEPGNFGALPFGTYIIKETRAPEYGFWVNAEWYKIVVIDEEGVHEYTGRDMKFNTEDSKTDLQAGVEDNMVRDDMSLRKVVSEQNENAASPLPFTPFLIVSSTTGERHVVVTDDSGFYSSAEAAMTGQKRNHGNVNKFDKYLREPDAEHQNTYWIDVDAMARDNVKLGPTETWFYGYPVGANGEGVHSKILAADENGAWGAFPYENPATYGGYAVYEIFCNDVLCVDGKKHGNSAYAMVTGSFNVIDKTGGLRWERTHPQTGSLDFVNTEIEIESDASCLNMTSAIGHLGSVADGATTIKDVVTYKRAELSPDQRGKKIFYLYGRVVDLDRGGNVLAAPDPTTGEWVECPEATKIGELFAINATEGYAPDMYFNDIPKTYIDGRTVVVYEELYMCVGDTPDPSKDILKASHCQLNDERQTVHYPDLSTKLKTANRNAHIASPEIDSQSSSLTLYDEITYRNLPTSTFTLVSQLYDVESDKMIAEIVDDTFRPDSQWETGTHEIQFTLTLEEIFNFYYDASAVPKEVFDKFATAEKPLNKGTFKNASYFTSAEQVEIVKYILEGRSLVATETLHTDMGGVVALHRDKSDENQTIHFPRLRTLVQGMDTNIKNQFRPWFEIDQFGNVNLRKEDGGLLADRLTLSNLPAGQYVVKGVLLDRKTGEVLKDKDGQEIRATQNWENKGYIPSLPEKLDTSSMTPEERKKYQEEYDKQLEKHIYDVFYDISNVAMFDDSHNLTQISQEFVAFEEIFCNDVVVASHESFNDPSQINKSTTGFSQAGILSEYDDEQFQEASVEDKNLRVFDNAIFTGLQPGLTYRLVTQVLDPWGVDPIAEVSNEFVFMPTVFNNQGDPVFVKRVVVDLPAPEDLEIDDGGASLYVAEILYLVSGQVEPQVVNAHDNPVDADQMIFIPKIGTKAHDSDFVNVHSNPSNPSEKDLHIGYADNDVTIIDTVSYSKLALGQTYTMTGTLMDKETGQPFKVDGKEVIHSVEFTTTEADREDPDNEYCKVCSGTVDIPFTIKNGRELLEGKTVVVFEDLLRENRTIAIHHDITDEGQSVHYPKIRTHAADGLTNLNEGSADQSVFVVNDRVDYWNLLPGYTYVATATLMDKDATKAAGSDKLLRDSANNAAGSGSTEFKLATNEGAGDGSINVRIALNKDSIDLHDKTVVVYETLSIKDSVTGELIPVASHTEIDDETQTVRYPELGTQAQDTGEGIPSHLGFGPDGATIVDTVSYKNLVKGKRYTVSGELHYRSADGVDEGPVRDANDNVVKASAEFEAQAQLPSVDPNDANGTVQLTFNVNGIDLCGKTLVVFEYLYGTEIGEDRVDIPQLAKHVEPGDEGQSVHYPEVGTTMLDRDADSHDGYAGNLDDEAAGMTLNLRDIVRYTNLIPGLQYKLRGKLMYSDGTPVKNADGSDVIGESEVFTPEVPNGEAIMDFTISGMDMRNKTTVAYEYLYMVADGREKLIGEHENPDDEGQSVHYSKVETTAADIKTAEHIGLAEPVIKVIDTVALHNLIVGNTYTVTGTLHERDKDGNDIGVLRNADGSEVTASEGPFVADKAEMTVYLTFTYTVPEGVADDLTVVAFESLLNEGGKLIGMHADITDEGQSVHYPKVCTTALDKETAFHEGLSSGEFSIVDHVAYWNLLPDREYTMYGTLMDKEAGEPAVDNNGKIITGKVEFNTNGAAGDRVDGSVDIVFDVSNTEYANKPNTFVVFEQLQMKQPGSTTEILVGRHEDIEDEDQSVHYPKIHTTALDSDLQLHEGYADNDITIIDDVEYTNLIPRAVMEKYQSVVGAQSGVYKYTMKGVLMDRESGKPILDKDGREITAEAEFTPESPDGSVRLIFNLKDVDMSARTAVVFEQLYHDSQIIAEHKDLTDEGQSVHYQKIRTMAYDSNTQIHMAPRVSANDDGTITVVDTVAYYNLLPGRKYTMSGTLMDKTTGQPLKNKNGADATASAEFTTPDTATNEHTGGVDGAVDIIFASVVVPDYEGNFTAVAFEELTNANGNKTAEHKDINDEDQSVHYVGIGTQAYDSKTTSHLGSADVDKRLVDTVSYRNLIPGQTYVIRGMLAVKADNSYTGDANGNVFVKGETGDNSANGDKQAGAASAETAYDIPGLKDALGVTSENSSTLWGFTAIEAPEQSLLAAKAGDKLTFASIVEGGGYNFVVNFNADMSIDVEKWTVTSVAGEEPERVDIVHVGPTTSDKVDVNNYDIAALDRILSEQFGVELDQGFNSGARARIEMVSSGDKIAGYVFKSDDSFANNSLSLTFNSDGSIDGVFVASGSDEAQTFHIDAPSPAKQGTPTTNVTGATGNTIVSGGVTFMADTKGNVLSGETTFIPDSPDGEITMVFDLTGIDLSGKTLVAFEELYSKVASGDEILIATHKDINDEAQSVHYPEIHTMALFDNGTKNDNSRDVQIVNDTVSYKNLIPGVEYTMYGTLHLKGSNRESGSAANLAVEDEMTVSGNAGLKTNKNDSVENATAMKKRNVGIIDDNTIKVDSDGTLLDYNGERVEAITKFTPTSSDGEVVLQFRFDARHMIYADLVAFEECYIADHLIAQHADINDEAQTVHIADYYAVENDIIDNGQPKVIKTGDQVIKTGDGVVELILKIGFVALVGAAIAMTARRRRKR